MAVCFVPTGNWDPKRVPLYNPTDKFLRVRLLKGNAKSTPQIDDIILQGRTLVTFDGSDGYTIIDEPPVHDAPTPAFSSPPLL